MATIKLRFAEIHAPLFLMGDKGTNLGTKLDPSKRQGLKLEYDRDAKELLVSFQDMSAIVPTTNVVSMLEETKASKKVDLDTVRTAHKVEPPKAPIQAQVSGPQSHVFAGPGAGQTGQEPPKAAIQAQAAAPVSRAPKGKK